MREKGKQIEGGRRKRKGMGGGRGGTAGGGR